jgi:choline dehydrogenase-like flavoprotein
MTPATSGFIDAGAFSPNISYDVCIIGSGAGGAVIASALASAGLHVIVLEEGGHHTKAEFKMREDQAFPMLYQESGLRSTKDLSISILQGRAVGGSTVINWTTSFRTPPRVLDHWRTTHAVGGFGLKDLEPHWDAVEERLNIQQIPLSETNPNNRLLYDGCKALGMQVDTTRRNTRNCFKSGYCGMGCPVDAKQSMLVTYLPDAVAKGALVVSRCRVDRLTAEAGRVTSAECSVIGQDGYADTGAKLTVRANRFVLSAGAIGTPAILIRSGLGGGAVGKRTFLHPVVGTAAKHKDPIEPFYGAPQSVASHALADRGAEAGLFFEAAPLHPMMCALASSGYGAEHRLAMTWLPHLSAHIVLAIDGFGPDEVGGTVEVRPSGAPLVDYQIPERIWSALKEGLRQLIRIDLAAGAEVVASGHDPAILFRSEKDLGQLDHARFEPNAIAVFSAHIMGGARMGDDPARSVVRSSDLRHHSLANLHVVDGSIFPTSLGVNPQETIYGIAHLMGSRFAQSWKS